jgi:O-antigen ligase
MNPGLFSVKDSLANKISYYHLMLLMASLPFDRFYSHLILGSYALHTLIHLKKDDIKKVFKWRTLILQSVFFITVLATIYSLNKPVGLGEWGKQVVILLFPVFFCLNPLNLGKYKSNLLLSFALVCTATIIYLYADVFATIKHYGLPLKNIFSGAFTNHNFSEPIAMHATFFSMQVVVALVYILSVLIKEQSTYKKLVYLFCGLVLTSGLIQLCSKSVFVALMIIINLAVPYFLLQKGKRLKYMAVSFSLSLLMVAGVLSSGTFRERFVNELKLDITKASKDETNDGRLTRWKVVTQLIAQKPIAGYGSGTEIGLLQYEFFSHKLYNSYLNRLNSHNQYLSLLLKSGIIGLLIYLATLAFGFNIALKKKDLLLFTFMILVTIVCLSENLLDVDKGICFYAFFFSFFIFSDERSVEDSSQPFVTPLQHNNHATVSKSSAVLLDAN